MKKLLLFTTVVLAAILTYVLFFRTGAEESFIPGKNEIIPDQYIVFMKESFEAPVINNRIPNSNRHEQQRANEGQRASKEAKLRSYLIGKGVQESKQKRFVDIKVGAVVKIDSTKARELASDPEVDVVIPDVNIQINPIQQSDPDININPIQQWQSPVVPSTEINPIQQSDSIQLRYDINPANHISYAVFTAGGPIAGNTKTTVIWFLDTGIDPTHPNLTVNRDLGVSFVSGNSNPNDDNGHGTFCAGAAAGKPILPINSGDDIIHYGVSEGATVVSVKVLDQYGRGSWGTVIAGLNYVAKLSQPGDVVNLSLGSYDASNQNCYYPGIKRAIERVTQINGAYQVFVILSAGNDAGKAECNRPGCIDATNVFTASSINADSTCAVYANFGPPVDFVTVGTRVFSCWYGGAYRMASGTSVSSAILAGIIHARGGAPASTINVTCNSFPNPIATVR